MRLKFQDYEIRRTVKEIPHRDLKFAYEYLVQRLNEREDKEVCKTDFENILADLIKMKTKLRFERSFWIGKRNFDFFFPQIKSIKSHDFDRNMMGLAIEVDGEVHNSVPKMNKDQDKYLRVHELDIGLLTIENRDFNNQTVSYILSELAYLPRLDYRGQLRVYRDIFVSTLIAHKSFIYDENLNPCISIIKELRRWK